MATVMGILAKREQLDISGMRIHVEKVMTGAGPRRIARLTVEVTVPEARASRIAAPLRDQLERAAHSPVRLSLLDAIEVPVVFRWG
jgi:hypothetical protein